MSTTFKPPPPPRNPKPPPPATAKPPPPATTTSPPSMSDLSLSSIPPPPTAPPVLTSNTTTATSANDPNLPIGWIEIRDGASTHFYNTVTKQSSYIVPYEVLLYRIKTHKPPAPVSVNHKSYHKSNGGSGSSGSGSFNNTPPPPAPRTQPAVTIKNKENNPIVLPSVSCTTQVNKSSLETLNENKWKVRINSISSGGGIFYEDASKLNDGFLKGLYRYGEGSDAYGKVEGKLGIDSGSGSFPTDSEPLTPPPPPLKEKTETSKEIVTAAEETSPDDIDDLSDPHHTRLSGHHLSQTLSKLTSSEYCSSLQKTMKYLTQKNIEISNDEFVSIKLKYPEYVDVLRDDIMGSSSGSGHSNSSGVSPIHSGNTSPTGSFRKRSESGNTERTTASSNSVSNSSVLDKQTLERKLSNTPPVTRFSEVNMTNNPMHANEPMINIAVILPKLGPLEILPKVSLHIPIASTIQQLLNLTFAKVKKNIDVDINEKKGRYIFKVVGFLDYFLHYEYKLLTFDWVVHCLRKKIKLEVELVKVNAKDLEYLEPLLTGSLEDDIVYEKRKLGVIDDNWLRNRDMHFSKLTNQLGQNIVYHHEIKWPFRVLIRGIENCPGTELNLTSIFCTIGLYYGGDLLGATSSDSRSSPNTQPIEPLKTTSIPYGNTATWPGVWLTSTKHEVGVLPSSVRIGVMLYGSNSEGRIVPVAGVSMTLVDYENRVLTGEKTFKLWPSSKTQIARDPELANPKSDKMPHLLNVASGVVGDNEVGDAGILHVVFDSYSSPVYSLPKCLDDAGPIGKPSIAQAAMANVKPSESEKEEILRLSKTDPLHMITAQDKHLLWNYREYCCNTPELLPKYLLSVQWGSCSAVKEAHRMLPLWATHPPGSEVEYLEMLDISYSDPVVREYVVRQLNRMNDKEFDQYMLQMVQTLKYEAYHDSPLSRMLLRRALQAPYKIGHNFYWLLRSEMHNDDICGRYGMILKAYIMKCGPHRTYLRRQIVVNDMVQVIAEHIKTLPKAIRSKTAAEELKKVAVNFPSRFQLCLSPRVECKGLKSDKCKVMSSKKMPIWLVFENSDPNGEAYLAIFKAGDDLRQDLMTLQLLRIMDHLWTRNGLDLRLNPYGCCSTGHDLGMIEVVKNSDTTAHIQVVYGGKNMGAWRDTPIDMFLREKNTGGASYDTAVRNFVHTCAGYCVATYVLGIGDRHADNIMVTNAGHLFHIDFGHFLGNFKSKFGYKRERAPFVFTPEMAYVMRFHDNNFGLPESMLKDSQKEKRIGFPEFEAMCCKAYNVLRQHSNLLMNLFILVTPAAMPELLEKGDVTYLKDMLSMTLTNDQADKKFKGEIKASLKTVSRRFDNWIHNLKHTG